MSANETLRFAHIRIVVELEHPLKVSELESERQEMEARIRKLVAGGKVPFDWVTWEGVGHHGLEVALQSNPSVTEEELKESTRAFLFLCANRALGLLSEPWRIAMIKVGISLAWWHFKIAMIELRRAGGQLLNPHYE